MTDKESKHELEYDPAEGVELNDTFGLEHIIESRDIATEIELDKQSNIHIPQFSHREFELESRLNELQEQIIKMEETFQKKLELTQFHWVEKCDRLKEELDEQRDLVRQYQSSAVKDSKIMRQQHDLLTTMKERFM